MRISTTTTRLRDDSVLALALQREDVRGEARVRERDRGHPLAGSSTLNRLELGEPQSGAEHRYKKIVAHCEALDALLVDVFIEAHQEPPEEIVLDLDATDDPLHGHQEGRFFHGYYRCYCYLPLYITCGEHVLCCRLRPSNIDASYGSVHELERIVARLRQCWAHTRIVVRGDSGFCREELMAWCEDQGVDFVFGLAKNPRLQRLVERQMRKSRRRCAATGKPSRRFRDFRYRTLNSWSRARRVVGKAEWLPGGARRQCALCRHQLEPGAIRGPRALYEGLYCARGEMENRIKGAATRPVRRPHLHRDAAREPASAVLLGLRRRFVADHPPAGARRHALRTRAMRHHPHPISEDRRNAQGDRAQGLGVVLQCLPMAGVVPRASSPGSAPRPRASPR